MLKKNPPPAHTPEGGCPDKDAGLDHQDGHLRTWAGLLPGLIDRLGQDSFPERLAQAARQIIDYENCIIFLFRGRAKPLKLFSSFRGPAERKAVRNYAEKTYVLNPFYQAYLKGLEPGVYRMRDLAPDSYFEHGYYRAHDASRAEEEEIGYITDNWPRGREEAQIAAALDQGAMVEISFNRPVSDGGFSRQDMDLLAMMEPAAAAMIRQHWQLRTARKAAPEPDTRIDDAFENFGSPVLSQREQEIIRLILRGHSSESIGLRLGIAITTVKTHRKKAYAKLEISSQSELLSLFLKTL